MIPTKHMSRFKTLTFGLIPVFVLLLILEVIGRIVYPVDREKRARIKAARTDVLSLQRGERRGHSHRHSPHGRVERLLTFSCWSVSAVSCLALVRVPCFQREAS